MRFLGFPQFSPTRHMILKKFSIVFFAPNVQSSDHSSTAERKPKSKGTVKSHKMAREGGVSGINR
jgi:hypothetical protein